MNPIISLLNNHDVEIRQKTQPGSIPHSDIANLLDAIALRIEKDVDYALGIPFDSMVSAMTGKQLTANDKYFVSQVGSIPGGGCILTLKGDGSHSPDLSNFLVINGSYSNTSGVVNQLLFYYDGANYCVSIIQLPAGAVLNTTAGSAGPDTTPPVVTSIAVFNSNPSQVVIAYSEALKTTAVPAPSDFVVTAGGSTATISSVAISVNTVLLNLASPIIAGSSNFIQYTPGTNKIQDLAGNLAAAIPVNTVITNNVGSSGGTQLGTPTVTFGATDTSSIVVNWSTVTSATNYIVKRNTSNTITGATQIYSGGLLTFTDTGLTAGTTYYYFVIAQATGFTDSNPGSGSMSTSGGLSYTPLNFATQTGITNTGGIWQGTIGSSGTWSNYGLADKKLAAATDGFIVWKYGAVDGESAMLGFDAQNTSQGYATGHYIAAAYIYGGTIYRIDNGGAVTSTATTIAVGSYIRIIRTAGVTKLQQSTDGTTWTDVYTYATLNAQTYANADFFVNINVDATNKCYYPQGSNLI